MKTTVSYINAKDVKAGMTIFVREVPYTVTRIDWDEFKGNYRFFYGKKGNILLATPKPNDLCFLSGKV